MCNEWKSQFIASGSRITEKYYLYDDAFRALTAAFSVAVLPSWEGEAPPVFLRPFFISLFLILPDGNSITLINLKQAFSHSAVLIFS